LGGVRIRLVSGIACGVAVALIVTGCGGGKGAATSASPTTIANTQATATSRSSATAIGSIATLAPSPAVPTPPIAATAIATATQNIDAPAPTATDIDAGTTSTAAAAMCASAAEVLPAATVASNDAIELSGLASSRVNDGVLWAHNDSGDTARVFAVGAHGEALATYTLAGADALDWEDIAVGPSASRDASELYVGDIGDNARARTDVVVYRLREPKVARDAAPIVATLSSVDRLTLRYPDGPHDAETLIVDSVSGDLIIVTKDAAGSEVFRAAGTLDANSTTTLELVGKIDFGSLKRRTPYPDDTPVLARVGGAFATGGDISPSGDVIAIRTYSAVWLWSRSPGQSVGQALAGTPCEAPAAAEKQGEAIAFDADGRGYWTSSEGEHPPLHHFRSN
jgi:hypothetical protein